MRTVQRTAHTLLLRAPRLSDEHWKGTRLLHVNNDNSLPPMSCSHKIFSEWMIHISYSIMMLFFVLLNFENFVLLY